MSEDRGETENFNNGNNVNSDNRLNNFDISYLQNFLFIKIDFKEKDRLLTGLNYDVWIIRIKGFFQELNLWSFVDDINSRLRGVERRVVNKVVVDNLI